MHLIKRFLIRLFFLSAVVGSAIQPVAVSADEGTEKESNQTQDAKQADGEDEEPDCD